MTILEIAAGIAAGKTVYCGSMLYLVKADHTCPSGFGVLCTANQYYIGLEESAAKDCFIAE